jgi:hypothetical protein
VRDPKKLGARKKIGLGLRLCGASNDDDEDTQSGMENESETYPAFRRSCGA